jgi:hypothetical protein
LKQKFIQLDRYQTILSAWIALHLFVLDGCVGVDERREGTRPVCQVVGSKDIKKRKIAKKGNKKIQIKYKTRTVI